MSSNDDHEITRFLNRWSDGETEAFNELVPLVYDTLRRIAARQLNGERVGHTLQPTALVSEAYLTLCQQRSSGWKNRTQFYCVAARIMRRVLVDHARRKRAIKRGRGETLLTLAEAEDLAVAQSDILAVEEALLTLESIDPRQARITELRFFAGLTIEETADALDISTATVKREWRFARAWLFQRLTAGEHG